MHQTLLIATHNRGKLREYQEIFGELPLRLVSLDEVGIGWDVAETGETFAENARLKAEAYGKASGLLTLADDSGLEVFALGGEPGVRSARYAGEHATSEQRYQKLLARMIGVPVSARQARFYCVIALAPPNGTMQLVEGECVGEIALAPRGTGGFGYDPIFWLPEYSKTMAELPADIKNRISHRGRAADAAKRLLQAMVGAS